VIPQGTVTLLLADIEGSTRLWEQRASEMTEAIARFDVAVNRAVAAHGGVRPVEQGEGDSFVAAFTRASDAVACALGLQLEFGTVGWPFRVRMALHTGEVQLRDDSNYVGATIARCARLRALAHGGQVVVSQAVRDIAGDQLPDGASLDDLGTHELRDLAQPERVFLLRHPDLVENLAPLRSAATADNNLPVELTSFVGRADDIKAVTELVRQNRIVTLLGTGGCGKTRLSLQVAAELLPEFPDGVWFVELAPVSDGDLVATAAADALGVVAAPGSPVLQSVVDRLAAAHALVVLDNCEHVLTAAAELVAAVLRASRRVTVLASTREPLGVPGELTYSVPSLQPDEAIELFAERATLARRDFVLDEPTSAIVSDICQRLDGIPLAVELAAARVRAMSLEQISAGLADRFRLLTTGARTLTPRQQTLRASVDWSYDLLNDAERVALQCLAYFAAGFTFDAVHVMLGDDEQGPDAVDLLTSLVDKSLVIHAAGRYHMLETIRQYGQERLNASGELAVVARRHRDYCLQLLRKAAAEEEGPEQEAWSRRIRDELDNVRVALSDAKDAGDGVELLELTCLTGNHWTIAGRSDEHRAWLQQALALAPPDAPFQPNALYQLGVTDSFVGEIDAAIEHIGASVPLYRAKGDEHGALWAVAEHAWNLTLGRGLRDGLPVYEEGIAAAEARGEFGALLSMEYGLSTCYAYSGHLDKAIALAEVALRRPVSVAHFRRWLEATYGWALAMIGRVDEGLAAAQAAIDESLAAGDNMTANIGGWMLGVAFVLADRIDEVAPLVAASFEAARGFGVMMTAPTHAVAAHAALAMGDLDSALAEADVAVGLAETLGPSWRAMFTVIQGDARAAAGDLAGAADTYTSVVGLSRHEDFPAHLASGLLGLARVAWAQGDANRAADLVHEAIPIFRAMGHRVGLIDALELLAAIFADTRLWDAAQRARDAGGYRLRLAGAPVLESVAESEPLNIDEAVELATRGRGERRRPASGWDALSPMEQQVAALVAEGLTNAQVGERLFISRHTVDTHLRHVYAKVGVSNRAELAAAAARKIT
jgi:predicted ATPase/class 3 adenylate cyclase/DNA-binding CsgD family transcriptional regulator